MKITASNKKRKLGYSEEKRKEFFEDSDVIISLSQSLTPSYRWEKGEDGKQKPTSEITGYSAWLASPASNEPFKVKFEKAVELPKFGTRVLLTGFEACEIGSSVYFRAKGLKVGS